MIKETDGDSFETMRSLEQNLSFQAAEAQFAKRKVPYDAAKMQTLGMVSSDDIYSNVALLLSEQCPSTIKAATFAGVDQSVFQDRREFTGSLFQQMEDLYAYLDLHNQTKATFEGLYRTDTKDYPEDALRETLMNSLVHRDYSFSASTLVSIYDDRIEFVSVGGLPAGITLDDIMLGLSVCRNPKLAAIFYRLQLIEAYGTGMPKINRNAVKATDSVPNERKSNEEKILDLIAQNGYVVRSDVDQLLDVSQTTASRILKRMVTDGLIYQDGSGRKTKYRKG